MITDFFNNISDRMYKENDLSDITWALCNSSNSFRDTFLRFFFPDITISPDIEIVREESRNDSRPDFVIHNGDDIYIIENKINDKQQHFGQYDKQFHVSPENFGYIANYHIQQPDKNKHYRIKTWEGFYKFLADFHSENAEEMMLVRGYREYLKNICNIIDFTKPMNISGIYSLYQLIEILSKLCNRETEHYSINVYNSCRTFDNHFADHRTNGINFEVNFKVVRLHVFGWIGIFFNQETPVICVGFLNATNWGKRVCNLIENIDNDGKLYSAPYEEDGAYWFDFTDGKETYEEYFNKLSLDKQTELLRDFFDEVLELIYNLQKNK
jgi:hypothetical protein